MGVKNQTQAANFAHLAITIPANGAAVTLLSLVGALALEITGQDDKTVAKNLHRITAVRITGQAGAYLFGKTAATALIAVAATGDLEEPVAGQKMLEAYFHSAAGAIAATAVIYYS